MTTRSQLTEAMRVDDVLADPYTPALAAIMPFFKDHGGYTKEEIASTVLRILIDAGGNPNRFYITEWGYQARMGGRPTVPSPETIRRSFVWPRGKKGSRIKHDLRKQDANHGLVFLAQFDLFTEETGLRDAEYYVTLDGSPTVNYGEKAYESSKPRSKLTESSLMSFPVTRRKNDQPVFFFRGSSGGFESLHCSGHVTNTKETQSIFIDSTSKRSLRDAVENCMLALAACSRKPSFIIADKEFTGNGAIWEILRDYADRRNVLVVGPKVRDGTTMAEAQRIWDDRLYATTTFGGETISYTFRDGKWSENSGGYRTYRLLFIFEQVPYNFKPDEHHGSIVQEGNRAKGTPRIAAFPIILNKNMSTEADAKIIFSCIPRRWACEDLFQRHQMRFGSSKARDFLPRQALYQLAFTALNSYGHWRAKKMEALTRPDDDATGMSWWIGDILACMDDPGRIGLRPILKRTRPRKSI